MLNFKCPAIQKRCRAYSQWYPWNLNRIKIWEKRHFVAKFLNSFKCKNCSSHFCRETTNEIISFWKQNHGYLIIDQTKLLRESFWIGINERMVMNRTLWKEGDESDSMKGGWWIGLYERRVMNWTLWKEGDESDSMKGG